MGVLLDPIRLPTYELGEETLTEVSTVPLLRNSERQSYKTCRWRWYQSYVEGLQAVEAPRALRFGDLIHQALAAYYKRGRKRGPHPAPVFERLYNEQAKQLGDSGFNVFLDEKWVDALDLGRGMLEGYVRQYGTDDRYEVISSEQTFKWTITDHDGFRFRAVGTFDGVWRDLTTDRIVFPEHKTAASISEDALSMDEQASLYWTYGPLWLRRRGIIGPDDDLSHILYNFLRKAVPDHYDKEGRPRSSRDSVLRPLFHRVPVYRDEADRAVQHERVIAEAREVNAARGLGLPVIKTPGPLHMPNCRGCFARHFCEIHEAGGDWESVRASSTVRWDAYAAHELIERK